MATTGVLEKNTTEDLEKKSKYRSSSFYLFPEQGSEAARPKAAPQKGSAAAGGRTRGGF